MLGSKINKDGSMVVVCIIWEDHSGNFRPSNKFNYDDESFTYIKRDALDSPILKELLFWIQIIKGY